MIIKHIMEKNFWYGKRVLVTGGEGFLASHLVKQLISFGACVTTTVRHARPLNTLHLIQENSKKTGRTRC